MNLKSMKPSHSRFTSTIPLNTLLFLIRLGLQTLTSVESKKEIPLDSTK